MSTWIETVAALCQCALGERASLESALCIRASDMEDAAHLIEVTLWVCIRPGSCIVQLYNMWLAQISQRPVVYQWAHEGTHAP